MPEKKNIEKNLTLSELSSGLDFKIIKIPDGDIKFQFMRLGVYEGEKLRCVRKLPGGTIIIGRAHQQIAVGSELAKKIIVEKL